MFKKGDKVKCVKLSGRYGITPIVGRIYTVTSVNPNATFDLKVDESRYNFLSKDFILANTKPESNCGRFSNSSV